LLNVYDTVGVRTNRTGTEQEIFFIGPTGSGVNDGFLTLLDSGTRKVLIAANNARGGDTYFNGGGNVGIGTDSPGYKLTCNGQPGANGYTAWANYSDVRLKENISDLDATNILNKICAKINIDYETKMINLKNLI
jgi:hypothetical protein